MQMLTTLGNTARPPGAHRLGTKAPYPVDTPAAGDSYIRLPG
jgi:hypothetical protein